MADDRANGCDSIGLANARNSFCSAGSMESVQSVEDTSPRKGIEWKCEDISPRKDGKAEDVSPRKRGKLDRKQDRIQRRCQTTPMNFEFNLSSKDRKGSTDWSRRKERRETRNMEKDIANILRGGRIKFMELLLSLAEEHENAIATTTAALISENEHLSDEVKRMQFDLVALQASMANLAPESYAPPATLPEEDEAKRKSLLSIATSATSQRSSASEEGSPEPHGRSQKWVQLENVSSPQIFDSCGHAEADSDEQVMSAKIASKTMPILPTLLARRANARSDSYCEEKSNYGSEPILEPTKSLPPLALHDMNTMDGSISGHTSMRRVSRLASCPATSSERRISTGVAVSSWALRPSRCDSIDEDVSPTRILLSPLPELRSPARPLRCNFEDDKELTPPEDAMEMLPLWRFQSGMRNNRTLFDRNSRGDKNNGTDSAETCRIKYYSSRSWMQIQTLEHQESSLNSTWEQYTRRFILKPGSRKRLVWDTCGLLLIGYDLVVIPMQIFDLPSSPFFDIMSCSTLAFWACDIPLSFFTGFHSEGSIELRIEIIARHYARTWLVFDIVLVSVDSALLVAGFLSEIMDRSDSAEYVRFGRILRFLRLLRLLRLLKVHGVINDIFERVHSEFCLIMFGIARVIVAIMLINHIIACSWYGIAMLYDDNDRIPTWVKQNGLQGQSLVYRYATSLHWSLTQFTPASMEVWPENSLERVFSVCVLLFAMVTFSSLISSITNAMTQLRNLNSEKLEQLSMLRRYLSENQASVALMGRIWGCLHQVMDKSKRRIHEIDVTILSLLPSTLKGDLQEEVYSPIFIEHPFWKQMALALPAETRKTYQCALEEESVSIGHEVFNAGDDACRMMFVFSGILSYMSENSEGPAAMITSGLWASEAALWIKWKHVGQLAATTHCELVALRPASFRAAIGEVPEPLKYAAVFAEYFKQHPDTLTDIWADQEVLAALTTEAFAIDDDAEQIARNHIISSRGPSSPLNWLVRRRSSVSKLVHALTSNRRFLFRDDFSEEDESSSSQDNESSSTISRNASKEIDPRRPNVTAGMDNDWMEGENPLPPDEMRLAKTPENDATTSFPFGVVPEPTELS